jgi:hypothetical protein
MTEANAIVPLSFGVGGALLGGMILAFPRLRRSGLAAILLVLLPPLFAALWWYDHLPSPTRIDETPDADQEILLRGAQSVRAVTDLGRRVPVSVIASPVPDTLIADIRRRYLLTSVLSNKVIERTDPDPTHNCYGWVFTAGRYWVPFDMVDGILTDNGYEPVPRPSKGDLAMYRNDSGELVHAGIVVLADESTLIESKWGPLGRYLHLPDDQPFGGKCTFYHSPRRGHVLDGIPAGEKPSGGDPDH